MDMNNYYIQNPNLDSIKKKNRFLKSLYITGLYKP